MLAAFERGESQQAFRISTVHPKLHSTRHDLSSNSRWRTRNPSGEQSGGFFRSLSVMSLRVLFIRHGDRDHSAAVASNAAIPLTPTGVQQASLTGTALLATGIKIDACFSSPFLRCLQTSEGILTPFGYVIDSGVAGCVCAAEGHVNRHRTVLSLSPRFSTAFVFKYVLSDS